MSKIEWTERTWNPITGCSKVSEGCKNCYALRMSWRHQHNPVTAEKYEGTVRKSEAGNVNFTGKLNLLVDLLTEPLQWKTPALVFVNSMSDLFHPEVPFTFIDAVFSVMADADWHTYQVLTKRPERMLAFFNWKELQHSIKWQPSANVWLGVSVENQKAADERIPLLLQVPAAVRFLSCEPLLGLVNLRAVDKGRISHIDALESHPIGSPDKPFISWVIAGGESGPFARPSHPDWFRSLRDQCEGAGVPFFFKQWGEWGVLNTMKASHEKNVCSIYPTGHFVLNTLNAAQPEHSEPETGIATMHKVGKKAAGNRLDGRRHLEFPLTQTEAAL